VSVTNRFVTVLHTRRLKSGVLVYLIDEEILEMMWEEFDSYAVSVVFLIYYCCATNSDTTVSLTVIRLCH
jgi:hypothetical protein